MPDKYAVIGNPVGHSLSPDIHRAFARATGQDITYDRLLAPLDAFEASVRKFFNDHESGRGLNVTLPFKREAWDIVDCHCGYALDAEAVNTIKLTGGRLEGHNTDGVGLLRDLEQNLEFPIRGKRVLIMGAGGATHGVVQPLLAARPESIIVANRTLDKAASLVSHFRRFRDLAADGLAALPYERLAGAQFDVVINATSAGLTGEMPPLPQSVFAPGALAYDMVYGKVTPFLKFAAARGARTADGIGMLVEQAAESFLVWRGVRPDTKPVIDWLRAEGGNMRAEGGGST
ncbi:MAG TPA: shikimate dehydrogenase [Burkholderiales bacterium]|nr:shikimate dehydrogenase [Burkholderiales bacterium]